MGAITWGNYLNALPRAVASPTLNGFKYCFSKPLGTFLEALKYCDRLPLGATRLLKDITRANNLINGMAILTKPWDLYQKFYVQPQALSKNKDATHWNWIALTKDQAALGFTIWDCLNYLRDAELVTYSPFLEHKIDLLGTLSGGTSSLLGLVQNVKALQSGFGRFGRTEAARLALSVTMNVSGLALAYLFSSYVGRDSHKTAKLFAKIGLFGAVGINTTWNALENQAKADNAEADNAEAGKAKKK